MRRVSAFSPALFIFLYGAGRIIPTVDARSDNASRCIISRSLFSSPIRAAALVTQDGGLGSTFRLAAHRTELDRAGLEWYGVRRRGNDTGVRDYGIKNGRRAGEEQG